MRVKLFILFMALGLSFAYEVGDQINIIDHNKTFEICYGNNLDLDGDGEIKLADFNGDLNGGHYYVILIDMSATWCGPCYSLIPYFDNRFLASDLKLGIQEVNAISNSILSNSSLFSESIFK